MSSQLSCGPSTAPMELCRNATCSDSALTRVTTRPASTSLCPPRYLEALCTTMSAPCSMGRWKNGVISVLSTMEISSRARAQRQTFSMSVIFISGLVGVSSNTAFVTPGRNAASSASRSLVSTYVAEMP